MPKTRAFGDWCIQLGLSLISGAIVAVAASIWIGVYALLAGSAVFLVGVYYKYPKH